MGKTGEDLSLVNVQGPAPQPGLELADTVVSRACSPPGDQVLGGSERGQCLSASACAPTSSRWLGLSLAASLMLGPVFLSRQLL